MKFGEMQNEFVLGGLELIEKDWGGWEDNTSSPLPSPPPTAWRRGAIEENLFIGTLLFRQGSEQCLLRLV